jgi:hypothetical protein
MTIGQGYGWRRLGALGLLALAVGCAAEPPPWDSSSQSIELSCGSFFEGSAIFRAERSELTREQLELLGSLEVTDGDDGCLLDARSCLVTITSSAGAATQYRATERDKTCGDESKPWLSFSTLAPLLETLHCYYSKQGVDNPLLANPLCLTGMFSPSGGATVHRRLHVDEPQRSYHVELNHCLEPNRVGQIQMTLTVDGQTMRGAEPSAPGEDDTCLAIDFTPTTTGDLDLAVTTTPSFLPAGDYYLLFR